MLTILEQTHLEEFVHTTALARARYDAERPEMVAESMAIVGNSDRVLYCGTQSKEAMEAAASVLLRRPEWTTSMSAMEIADAEDRAFLNWRSNLARIEEDNEGVVLSPFERNVDFWRQLWRTVERSDIIVQIVDARDPLFFLSRDLFKYVEEVAQFQNRKKNCVLLVNKADFVPTDLQCEWDAYWKSNHTFPVVNFSALGELHEKSSDNVQSAETGDYVLGEFAEKNERIVNAADFIDMLETRFNPKNEGRLTVGMVGFPNVGKSSVINALLGTKKVSASSTPGKTKHIQTIELNDNILLCDCPGIVLPSVVSSKAHLVVNATMPLDHLRGGVLPAVELVVERMGGLAKLLAFYRCEHTLLPQFKKLGSDGRALLCALAVSKKYFLSLNVPDESKSARVVLKDVCQGKLVHVMHPPGSAFGADLDLLLSDNDSTGEEEMGRCRAFSDDFDRVSNGTDLSDDIADFLLQSNGELAPRVVTKELLKPPTKRAVRMGSKKNAKKDTRFCGSETEQKLANQIASLKPGGRGRISKALADPYGCHAPNEL